MKRKRNRRSYKHLKKSLLRHRFGMLKVIADWTPIHRVRHSSASRVWLCRCDCGRERLLSSFEILTIHKKSCGCPRYRRGRADREFRLQHLAAYWSWEGMRKRCYGVNHRAYEDYGGRGIKVCNRWRQNFRNFVEDMGCRPSGTTLDRIDPNKGYNKRNCRWADGFTQAHNKRNSKLLTPEEEAVRRAEWEADWGEVIY